MTTRTNLKLQLMKQRIAEEEKREQQQQRLGSHGNSPGGAFSRSFQGQQAEGTQTQSIPMPTQSLNTTEVPPQVLQVRLVKTVTFTLHYVRITLKPTGRPKDVKV